MGTPHAELWAYSIALAVWPFGLFVGGPVIGELSDKFGRKPTLLIALSLTAVAYGLSAASILIGNFWLFVVSRLMSGVVGGAYEVAQATVVDISDKETKARNLGYVSMAASIGFVIGPVVTSLSTSGWLSWMTISTPFWIAMGLAAINTLSILKLLERDKPKHPDLKLHPIGAAKTVGFLFLDKRVLYIGAIYLLLQAGWGFYTQGVALFMHHYYHYDTGSTGYFYAAMGLAVALCSVSVQPWLLKRFSPRTLYSVMGVICALLLVIAMLSKPLVVQWITAVLGSATQFICYTVVLMLLSGSVSEKEQGKVMGSAGAGFGLAWGSMIY
ncbi:MFS transporter [Dongshaea marina]|uniref:MFS transporter n=1 Tax=Dongshaea marina TaxID=2047966 RepID=UPI00131F1306|nr:MFS transporter [Dongshaea marina]